ncbi:MAG: Endopeptidase La [Actinomycetota bacterium]|nr:Endopeptidase La [Actinomycetota bacterium]
MRRPKVLPASGYGRLLLASVVAALLLLISGLVLPVPYVIVSPGPVFNTIGEYDGQAVIEISGTRTYPTTGQLNMTTVRERGGPYGPLTAVEAVLAYFDDQVAVLPRELLFPAEESAEDSKKESASAFSSSQSNAIAAALRYLKIPVTEAVVVAEVTEDSVNADAVSDGDVIKSFNGKPVTSREQLVADVRATPVGSTVPAVVVRDGKDLPVQLKVGANPKNPEWGFLGISLETSYRGPFEVDFTLDGVGGPSAGLMFALGTVDQLTPGELTGGKQIAGTGTIGADGKVGPIGGIRQKMEGAREDGATLFLAPKDNCDEVVGNVPEGLAVAAVADLAGAVAAIDDYRAGRALPACPAAAATPPEESVA